VIVKLPKSALHISKPSKTNSYVKIVMRWIVNENYRYNVRFETKLAPSSAGAELITNSTSKLFYIFI